MIGQSKRGNMSPSRDPVDERNSKPEQNSTALPECGDSIDAATFEQILEMDDDEEEREFSRSIVFDFFQQARSTFDKMDTAV